MRNIGGQRVGVNSKSVFGQPGRVSGICVGEWEERSPWAPLSERRGVAASETVDGGLTSGAVTVHGVTGMLDIADIIAQDGATLVEIIGKSLAIMGTNAFIGGWHGAEVMVAIAPPWADLIAATYPDIDDLHEQLWQHAALPLSFWPAPHRHDLETRGRVGDDGMVRLVETPQQAALVDLDEGLRLHTFTR